MAKVGQVIGVAIDNGSAVVCIATDGHLELLQRHVTAGRIDLPNASTVDQVVCLDAPATLAKIAGNDVSDVVGFAEVVGAILDRASTRHSRVWIFSDLALMRVNGHYSGAIELERLLASFAAARPDVFLYCAYPTNEFTSQHDHAAFVRICDEHCRILQNGRSLGDRSARES